MAVPTQTTDFPGSIAPDGRHVAGKVYLRVSLLLFAVVAMLGLYTLPDYGMCWDEFYRWEGGQQKFVYYQALFRGEDAQALLPKARLNPCPSARIPKGVTSSSTASVRSKNPG